MERGKARKILEHTRPWFEPFSSRERFLSLLVLYYVFSIAYSPSRYVSISVRRFLRFLQRRGYYLRLDIRDKMTFWHVVTLYFADFIVSTSVYNKSRKTAVIDAEKLREWMERAGLRVF